ncbi:MAG: tetratricopeptide repeat protein, partial [Candidatus Sericytochromatia bacterium]
MFIPLIKSKFKLPKLSKNYVPRYRLLEKLELGLTDEKKLTLVTGNPGYGKTSLVSDYVEKSELKYFWYTVNEGDNDLIIFINHFIKGIQLVIDGITDKALELSITSSNPSEVLNNIAGLMADEISSNYSKDLIIVIDDYHNIRNSENINRFLEYFIEYLPEHIQLILISRTTPNLKKFPQMRMKQQISEISNNDLKLSKEEFEEILPEQLQLNLTKEEKDRLYNKIDGWSGILVLITQTYSSAELIRQKILNVSDLIETVNDYIAQEIFDIQDEKTKEFMILSSPLPYLNKDICQNIGLTSINEMLEYLRNSSFIRSDNEEEYKYNSVLKDFLYDRAEETLGPKKLNEIYSGIAANLISKNEIEQALDYLFMSQSYKEAEDLVTDIAQELLNTNRTETLYKNLTRFPEDYSKNSCNIQIYLGEVNRLWGKYSEATECFYKAEELAIKQNSNSLLGRVYIYESIMLASKGENSGNLIDESLKILPEDDNYGLAFAYNTKGITYLFGEKVSESLNYFEKSLKYYENINDTLGQAKVLHNMGFAYSMLGSFEHSRETYERSVKQAESSSKYPYIMTYNNIAIIYNYLGNFNEAHRFAEKALEISQKLKYKRDMSYAYWTLGMISANLEDFLKAENYFNESLSIGLELGDRQVQAYALSGLSEISRLQDKLTKADDLINEAIRRRDLPIDNSGNIELLMQRVSIKSALKDFESAKNDLEIYLVPKVEKLKYKYYLTHIYFFLSIVYENIDKKIFDDYTTKVSKLIKENNYWFFLKQQSYIPELLTKKLDKNVEVQVIKPSKIRFYCFGEFKTYLDDKLVSNKDWNGFKCAVEPA